MSYKVSAQEFTVGKRENWEKESLSPYVCSLYWIVPSLQRGVCQLSVSCVRICLCQPGLTDHED